MAMDKVDVAILRELTQSGLILPGKPGFTPSYREVSKKVKIPFGTVRNRMNAMYKLGILKGSSIYPNPNLFGLRVAAYTMIVPAELDKTEVFQKLKGFEGLLSCHNFLGRMAWITFVFADEQDLDRKLAALRKIAGPQGILSSIPFPPCPKSLSPAEALLMLQLSTNGLTGYSELGKRLNISPRSLVRRISKIAEENMILSIPKVDYSAMAGSVPADLVIVFADDQARAAGEPMVLGLVKEYVILAGLFDLVGMCSLILPNAVLLKEIGEKVKQIEGVTRCYLEVVIEHVHEPKILVEYLQKRINASKSSEVPLISPERKTRRR